MSTHAERLARFVRRNKVKTASDGRLVLYKAVRMDFGSWYCAGMLGPRGKAGIYKPGTEVRCDHFSADPACSCGLGLHVSTFGFAWKFNDSAPTIVQVLVDPADIVCVPIGRGSKLRVKRLYVNRTIYRDKIQSKRWKNGK